MKRNLWAIAAMAAVTFGLYGCGDSNSTSSEPVNNESENNEPVNVPLLPISNLSKDLCGDLWCERDDYMVKAETGSDEETAGYWFMFSDSMEPYKGNSDIKLSYDVEADKDDGGEYSHFFCGSSSNVKIQGAAVLGDAYENPFAGIGFNLVSEGREPMDISSWEGVCLVYSSTGKLALELAPSGSPLVLESNNFGYELPKTKDLSMINVPWSAFGLYDVSKSPSTDTLWTVQNAAAIELRFYENSDFYVYSIGRLGSCGNSGADVPKSSSSSISSSSSSSSSVKSSSSAESTGELKASFLWKGDDTEGRVITGSPDETSGYWYYYDDNYSPNNGNSKIVFPSDVVEDEFGNFFGPLNVKYGGIKADVQIGPAYEYGFVGLGFNIWSENQEGVDITKWDGICLTYSSAESFAVQLRVEDEATTTEYCSLQWIVPKSDVLTTVSYPWSKLYSSCGWGGLSIDKDRYLQKVSSITLKFSKSGEFLLKEIGSLDACGK